MKRLEELGISPAPWKVVTVNGKLESVESCMGVESPAVCKGMRKNVANARLIAAAPELYECLREAAYEYCHSCENGHGNCQKKDGDCFVQKWRAALAKASGESEVE